MTIRSTRRGTRAAAYLSPDDAPGKAKILTTALALFVRDGLCETSVRDIAEGSGFTNPALFKHFRSKNELAEFLFEQCYLELERGVASAIAGAESFAARQRAVIEAYLDALESDAASVLYVQDNLRHFWPKMPTAVRRRSIVGDVRRLLESGRSERKVTTAIDSGLLTIAWIGTLQQVARARYFGDVRQPIDALAGDLDALLTKLVSP